MRTKLLAILLFVCMVFAGFGLAQAATSQLDNQPGGAAVAYWQASNATPGWQTFLDVQEVSSQSARVHLEFYTQDSVPIISIPIVMTALDNFGIAVILNSDNSLSLSFYSAPGTANVARTNIVPVSADGVARGYVTMVRDNISAAATTANYLGSTGTGVATTGTITAAAGAGFVVGTAANCQANGKCLVPDSLYVTAAYIKGAKAFAVPGAMLQGFVITTNNITESAASDDWIDTTTRPDSGTTCDFNQNNNNVDIFNGTANVVANGNVVSFVSLFQTDNIFAPIIGATTSSQRYRTICNGGQNAVPAFGSATGAYTARFNATAAVTTGSGLTSTLLFGVMPATSDPAVCTAGFNACQTARWSRAVTAYVLDDAEANRNDTQFFPPEAFAIPFGSLTTPAGSGNVGTFINIPSNGVGELFFTAAAPLYGFTYTESTDGFADVYPLGRVISVYLPNVIYDQAGLPGASQFAGSTVGGVYVAPALVDASLDGGIAGAAQLVTDYGSTTFGGLNFAPRANLVGTAPGTGTGGTAFRDAQLSDNSSVTPSSSGIINSTGFGFGLRSPWANRNRQSSYQEAASCVNGASGFVGGVYKCLTAAQTTGDSKPYIVP